MQLRYPVSTIPNPLLVLRRAGYALFSDPKTGQSSYVLRLHSSYYPRFHLYVENKGDTVILNLHLDQKQPSYGVGHMHSGEYDGKVVEEEMGRIDRWVKYLAIDQTTQPPSSTRIKKSWWRI